METLVLLFLTPVMVLWEGYVLSVLWRWFVVPTFGLPALSVAVAVGLALLVGMLTHQQRKDDPEVSKLVAAGIAGPAMFLLCGWVAKWFI